MRSNLLLCGFFLLGLLVPAAQAAEDAKITVLESLGAVSSTAADGAAITLKADSKLEIGTHIVTGADGTLLLQTEKGHTFRVGHDADFVLDKYYIKKSWFNKSKSKDVIRISLKKGKLRAKLEHLGRLKKASVRIKTPTAIAGIRGSDGLVEVDDMGAMEFTSFEGECYVEVEGYEAPLIPGQAGKVGVGETDVTIDDAAPDAAAGMGFGVGGAAEPAPAPSEGGGDTPAATDGSATTQPTQPVEPAPPVEEEAPVIGADAPPLDVQETIPSLDPSGGDGPSGSTSDSGTASTIEDVVETVIADLPEPPPAPDR